LLVIVFREPNVFTYTRIG